MKNCEYCTWNLDGECQAFEQTDQDCIEGQLQYTNDIKEVDNE